MAAKLDYTFAADAIAAKGGVPPSLVSALVNAESAWNPAAVSSTGCTGLGQFCQAAAKDYGLMGDGFDNRKDAALNLTATVKYLAALKKSNPTWADVIGHYSGQLGADGKPDFSTGYARYSAGQVLIMTINALDGTTSNPSPPSDGEGPVIVIDSITGHEQSTGRPATFIAPMVALGMMGLMGSIGIAACRSAEPSLKQVAIQSPVESAGDHRGDHAPVFAGSTFMLVPGPLGPLAAPLPRQ